MSSVLPYQSKLKNAQLSTREFDAHFELEVARRLRKRFMWYCAASLALSLIITLAGALFDADEKDANQSLSILSNISTAVGVVLYIIALVWAWRMPPKRSRILTLAMWLYIVATLPALLSIRISYELIFSNAFSDSFIIAQQQQKAAGIDAPVKVEFSSDGQIVARPATSLPTTSPTTRPVMSPRTANIIRTFMSAPFIFGMVAPMILLFHHLFICLFMPWTLRQSLAPALVVLAIAVVFFTIDLSYGTLPWWSLPLFTAISALAFVPGSLWCWWRFSQMRANVKLRYESDKFHMLQSELLGARRILETSLPAPRSDGPVHLHYVYEPMRQIGGDLLFVQESEGSLNVVLLDVTGHGIAAALTVNRLIGELERLFAEQPDTPPADVLIALNRYVYYTMSKFDMFVSAIALRIDTRINQMLYANAGHPTAFVRRVGGGVEALESTAVLLGVEDVRGFEPESIRLAFHPGDVAVLYTDGASEARSSHTQLMLGIAGVRKLIEQSGSDGIGADQWPAEIMRRVTTFRNAIPDDDTLVATVYRPLAPS